MESLCPYHGEKQHILEGGTCRRERMLWSTLCAHEFCILYGCSQLITHICTTCQYAEVVIHSISTVINCHCCSRALPLVQSTKIEDSGPPIQAYYKKLPCTAHGSVKLKHIASTSKCTKRSPKAPPGYRHGVYKEETCRF